MKQTLAVAVALLGCAGSVAAEEHGFKRPYFGATRPGTFARQKATDERAPCPSTPIPAWPTWRTSA